MENNQNNIDVDFFSKIKTIKLYDSFCEVSFDLNFYDLESVYSAAYSMMEKAYFFFSGSKDNVVVSIFPKDLSEIMSLSLELNNKVINYSFYKIKSVENKSLKELILSRSLFVSEESSEESLEETPVSDTSKENYNFSNHDVCSCEENKYDDENLNEDILENDEEINFDDFEFQDIDNIKVPWEEKGDSELLEEERDELKKIYDEKNKQMELEARKNKDIKESD